MAASSTTTTAMTTIAVALRRRRRQGQRVLQIENKHIFFVHSVFHSYTSNTISVRPIFFLFDIVIDVVDIVFVLVVICHHHCMLCYNTEQIVLDQLILILLEKKNSDHDCVCLVNDYSHYI